MRTSFEDLFSKEINLSNEEFNTIINIVVQQVTNPNMDESLAALLPYKYKLTEAAYEHIYCIMTKAEERKNYVY